MEMRRPDGYIHGWASDRGATSSLRMQTRGQPMTNFKDREKGFEAKFKKDQELQFKVMARRNKLLGLWAAGKLGMDGEAAAAYAKEVVVADFDEPGDKDVLRKIVKDFSNKGVSTTEHGIRREMDRFLELAKTEIAKEV
jgi:hypothetical protein